MGLGLSFTSALIVGYFVREIVYWVSYSIYGNKLRAKAAGRISQIIVATALGIIAAPFTLDFISIAMSVVYIFLLLLDIWVAERVLLLLQRAKEYILQSSAAKYLTEVIDPYIERMRKARMLEDRDPNQKPDMAEGSPPNRVIIVIKNVFVFSVNIVFYQVLVRSIVMGVSIGVLHVIEKTVEVLIDHFLDALVGPIGTQLGHGCNTVLIKAPRVILEKIRDFLDLLFGVH